LLKVRSDDDDFPLYRETSSSSFAFAPKAHTAVRLEAGTAYGHGVCKLSRCEQAVIINADPNRGKIKNVSSIS
jgi:hypothetical protein